MTGKQHSISNKPDFLFSRPSVSREGKNIRKSFVGIDELFKVFPDAMIGKVFIESAMARVRTVSNFSALAIRIDNFIRKDRSTGNQYAVELLIDVASAIDIVCKQENGIWGLIDRRIFSCLFTEKDEILCRKVAEAIHKKLADSRKETISIGIASYPLLFFSKLRTFENARKALDRAAYLSSASTACFDSMTLNISGDKMYQEGNIHGAIEEFKTALLINPNDTNIHNSLGVCYGVLGSFEKALESFESASKSVEAGLQPVSAVERIMPLYNSGLIYLFMDNKKKALEYFIEAAQIDENVFEVAIQTAKLCIDIGKFDDARKFLDRALKIRPRSASVHRCFGDYYTAKNMQEKALMSFRKAVKQNPYDAASLSALGYLFDIRGENIEIATVFCEHSVEISPDNGLYRYRLGRLYIKQNRLDDALREFITASKLGYNALPLIEKIQSLLTAKAS